jgi:TIR domain
VQIWWRGTAEFVGVSDSPITAAIRSVGKINVTVESRSDDRDLRLLFVCYRRDDTQDAADRLHERLVQTYGAERVFMDADNVPLGVNFVRYISEQLRQCGVVLVMIGRNWSKVTDEAGHRRLDDPADHVRVEIKTALGLGVPVIPLLVQDASMPRANELPEDIRDLAFQNGMPLPRAFWGQSVDKLLRALDRLIVVRKAP